MPDDKIINQHYVPQAYLRNFANVKGQIWVYDKTTGREFQTNVRNVAAERRFYDNEELASITGDPQFIEKHLGNLEGRYETRCKALIASLSSGVFRQIKPKDRHFFSAYMVVQMIRTKESRILHEQMGRMLLEVQKSAYRIQNSEPPSDDELLDGSTIEAMARDIQHRRLLDGEGIQSMANILYRHIWLIQRAFPHEDFLTSDHPVVKRGHITNTWRSMTGIASEGIEILFPISPGFTIALVERRHFQQLAPLDGRLMTLDFSENMIYNNQFQIRQSNRFVFSRSGNFDFTKTVLEEEPHHADPNRKRVETNLPAGGECQ